MNADWLRWYYLIYLLPAGMAVLVLLLSGLGGGGESDGDVEGVGDVADTGVGDVGDATEIAEDVFGEGAEEEAQPGAARDLLGFFGVGRAPLTIVLGSLMIGWGLCGLLANELLQPRLGPPARFIGLSMAIAAVGSLLCARLFAELAARLMPKDESYVISREGLIGLPGKVIYPVSETSGRVHLRDRYRHLHTASARVVAGAPPIGRGTEVIVASLDSDGRYVIVEPFTVGKLGK